MTERMMQDPLKPLIKQDGLMEANPRILWYKIKNTYWYFESIPSKLILVAMAGLSVYAIFRMIFQGLW